MLTCCTSDSSVINLSYSEQQVFSHTIIRNDIYISHITTNFLERHNLINAQTTLF